MVPFKSGLNLQQTTKELWTSYKTPNLQILQNNKQYNIERFHYINTPPTMPCTYNQAHSHIKV